MGIPGSVSIIIFLFGAMVASYTRDMRGKYYCCANLFINSGIKAMQPFKLFTHFS